MIIYDADIIGPWLTARGGGQYVPGMATGIGRVSDGRIVAGVMYEQYNGENVVCHVASEGRNWATRTYLNRIFDYPFNQLKVRRITVLFDATNATLHRFVMRLGFEFEARLIEAHPNGDLLVYRMFADQCKYIRGPYELRKQPENA